LNDITDGASNTIAVIETYGLGIRWYEPRDLRVDEMSFKINDPEYVGIASRHPGGVDVALADGSVRFLPENTDPRAVEAMTTINGGEDVSAVLKRD
jgi:prepilin-type processing-associated H-X9-DG protein